MPRFAANLSSMFTEVPFLERFTAAARAGFQNVRLQLDLYHRQIGEGDLIAAVREFGPYAAHVQIAQPPHRGEPDRGEIRYREVLSALDDCGYRRWVGCEYRPRSGTLAGLSWLNEYTAG